MMKRRSCLTALAAVAYAGTTQAAGPAGHIQIHVDLDVDPGKEKQMLQHFERDFKPAAGEVFAIQGQGSGPIEAFVNGVNRATGRQVRVLDYHEHAMGAGAGARAIAYLELRIDEQQTLFGVGLDTSFVTASLKAIVSALARAKIGRGKTHAQPPSAVRADAGETVAS